MLDERRERSGRRHASFLFAFKGKSVQDMLADYLERFKKSKGRGESGAGDKDTEQFGDLRGDDKDE